MVKIDLYFPYKGEIEIMFLEKDINEQVVFEVDLWYADFTSLMRYIPIISEPHPDGVLYNWQKGIGFFDEENWECTRVQEFYDQIVSINNIPAAAGLDSVINALIQICQSVLTKGNKLFIEYI